jgi:serine/threonine protein kinase
MADHKYRVIKRLEAGGMAEVYLGEASSVEGFKKRVAIKRVLPHLAQNENFVQMFLDEARLSARLNHANIVSVFDISAREDTFFLIMEFIDGANLKKILETLQKRGQRFPLAEAVYICTETARGLSYAHELSDENGVPLRIVHRDISPPNIMVTKRGEVKVADFGLAKAGTQISQTDPGVVKGKFSYLSPEAANGKEVDARADIFSMGIVLWEMLAGRRLFLGETDYATVKLIQQANIPRLSPLNPQVDEAFEEILLKALTRDPERRYQNAREFGDALTGYLFHRQLKVSNYEIANLVNAAMSDEPIATTKNDSSLIDRLIQEELDESVGLAAGETPAADKDDLSGTSLEGLEDPASWFSGESMAPPRPASVKPAAAKPAAPGAQASSEPRAGWRESGVALPAVAFDDEAPTSRQSRPEAGDRHTLELDADEILSEPAPSSAQGVQAQARRAPEPPAGAMPPVPKPGLAGPTTSKTSKTSKTAKPKGGAGKYVLMGMAVLAVAAIAAAALLRVH